MLFTPETADILREKGLEVRKANRIKRDRLFETVQELESKLALITAVTDRAGKPDPVILAQLKQLDQAILAETDPALLVRLVQAKATLYGLIHPKPGIARPRKARSSLDLPPPSPVQPSPVQPVKPEPSQPNPAVPGTTSSS